MKAMLLIFVLCLMTGCAAHRGEIVHHQPTLNDAIQAVADLRVGMSDDKALKLIARHGIQPSGMTGGTMAWRTSAILSDKSQLVLDFRYESRELRDKRPSKLTGWRVLDPSRKLLPEVSLYDPPRGEGKDTITRPSTHISETASGFRKW